MITAIIFDMNGVITDDEDCHELATKQAFDQVGVAITPEIYRKYCLGRPDITAFKELIRRLHTTYILALTTSSTNNEVETVMTQLEVGGLFRTIVTAEDVKNGKPDPEPYMLTAEKLGVDCANCLVIEDSENGVRSTKSAGMKCIAITNSEHPDKLHLADQIISQYSEITESFIQSL